MLRDIARNGVARCGAAWRGVARRVAVCFVANWRVMLRYDCCDMLVHGMVVLCSGVARVTLRRASSRLVVLCGVARCHVTTWWCAVLRCGTRRCAVLWCVAAWCGVVCCVMTCHGAVFHLATWRVVCVVHVCVGGCGKRALRLGVQWRGVARRVPTRCVVHCTRRACWVARYALRVARCAARHTPRDARCDARFLCGARDVQCA